MRKAFAGLAILLLLIILAQFYFAASGAFGTAPGSFRPHHTLGYVIFFVPLVMTVVGALARMPGRLIGMAALVAALTGVQVAIGAVARAVGDTGTIGPLIFGLHAINGLAILAVAGMIAWRARALVTAAGGLSAARSIVVNRGSGASR